MFKGLIDDAKSAAVSLVAKCLARAAVAVPFLIALGFAIAAATHMLSDRFGPVIAYCAVAGTFALLGLVTMLVVRGKGREEVAGTEAAK
jgi:hypothetical protein